MLSLIALVAFASQPGPAPEQVKALATAIRAKDAVDRVRDAIEAAFDMGADDRAANQPERGTRVLRQYGRLLLDADNGKDSEELAFVFLFLALHVGERESLTVKPVAAIMGPYAKVSKVEDQEAADRMTSVVKEYGIK